jgi:hypothetical protein
VIHRAAVLFDMAHVSEGYVLTLGIPGAVQTQAPRPRASQP